MDIAPGAFRTKRDMLRKLSYYVSGIAIGFILLGLFQKYRTQELQRRQTEAAKPVEPSPLFPPPPPADPTPTPSTNEPLRNPN